MKRLCILTAIIVSLLIMGGALPTRDAVAQQKSVKEQLLGTWTLVSIDYVGQDGSRFQTFGHDPKGIAIFDGSGHYIIAVMRSDRPKFAVNDRLKGTEEENKATAQGTITYFGTYSVSEADRTIVIHIVGSSFPNWNGSDQKRIHAHGRRTEVDQPYCVDRRGNHRGRVQTSQVGAGFSDKPADRSATVAAWVRMGRGCRIA